MSNITPLDNLKATLSLPAMKEQFKSALPPHISPDKFVRVVMTAVSQNKDLVDADRNSLFASCLKSAADGLLCDGREAALTIFKDKSGSKIATYMPMTAGILKKIRNSGELSSITAQIVYGKDSFKYYVDADGEHINHEPNLFGDRGSPIGVYALAKTKDGGVYIEVLTVQQVEAIKKVSRSAQYGPWSGPFEHEMWKKSAIRRLSKRLPMSTDIDATLHADDDLFMSEEKEVTHEPQVTPEIKDVQPKKKSSLKEAMEKSSAVKEPSPVALDDQPPSKDDIPI